MAISLLAELEEEEKRKANPRAGISLLSEIQPTEVVDDPPADAALQQPPAAPTPFQEKPIPERLQAVGGAAANILSSGAGAVLGGLAGLGEAVFGGDAAEGARTSQSVEKALTTDFQGGRELLQETAKGLIGEVDPDIASAVSSGSQAFEQTKQDVNIKYGPEAATFLEVLPIALLETIPGFSVFKKARQVTPSIADEVIENVDLNKSRQGFSEVPAEAREYQQIADDLRAGKSELVAPEVRPDQEIVDSAERLNIVLNPGSYSTNRAFIDVEQSLKSRPESQLSVIEERSIIDTGDRADKLITEFGGTTDKSLLDVEVRDSITSNIKALETKSGEIYKKIGETIPREIRVRPRVSQEYIKRTLADLGGDESVLSGVESRLLGIANKNPTYAALDRLRKDIGSAYQGKGPFKDDAQGNLDQVYKVLSEDQQAIVSAFGLGADYSLARKLVSTRKGLEKEAIGLFGRDLGDSLIPRMTAAASALPKGDVSKLKKLMNTIPEGRRQEVAATMLNDVFTQGGRKGGRSLSEGFVGAYAGLNRNPGAKAELFKHLPKGARKRFDDIGRVATGIFRSKALENKSKTARDIISSMNDGGMFARVFATGKRVVPFEVAGQMAGVPGIGAAAGFLSGIGKRTPKTDIADKLITSKEFKRAIEEAAKGNTNRSNNITKGRMFQKWLETQPSDIKAEIAIIGIIPYLTGESE